jgi:hypothetical protein
MLVQHLGCTFVFLIRTNERRKTMEWRHRIFSAGARTPPRAHERRRGRTNTLLPFSWAHTPVTYMGDYLETTSGYYSHSGHIPLLPGGPPQRPAGLESGDYIFLTPLATQLALLHTQGSFFK